MELDKYQERANETAVYPDQDSLDGIIYCTLGLVGESGEMANKIKKALRGDPIEDKEKFREELVSELGDVIWYLAQLCTELRLSLNAVATLNLAKLAKRKVNDTIKGDGDTR